MRFRSRVLRKLISLLNCLSMIVYLGLCLYAPTLALDAVTPLSLWIYIPLLGAIVTVYSSLVRPFNINSTATEYMQCVRTLF